MNKPKNITELKRMWRANVKECRAIVGNRKLDRLLVASKAMQVCEITWGGSKYRNLYTLKQFANEIGIKPATLANWVAVKKLIYDKLDPKVRNKTNYTDCAFVARTIKPNTPRHQVNMLVKNSVRTAGKDKRLLYTRLVGLRSLANSVCKAKSFNEYDDKTLEECLYYSKQIFTHIKSKRPDLMARDHSIVSRHKFKQFSANEALGRINIMGIYEDPQRKIKVKIDQKDQEVFDYLKDKKKYLGPTQIGIAVGKKNKNAASAWACRSLFKLLDLRLVERNKKGHYKAVTQ